MPRIAYNERVEYENQCKELLGRVADQWDDVVEGLG